MLWQQPEHAPASRPEGAPIRSPVELAEPFLLSDTELREERVQDRLRPDRASDAPERARSSAEVFRCELQLQLRGFIPAAAAATTIAVRLGQGGVGEPGGGGDVPSAGNDKSVLRMESGLRLQHSSFPLKMMLSVMLFPHMWRVMCDHSAHVHTHDKCIMTNEGMSRRAPFKRSHGLS